jgi:hypothetical protein
LALGMTTHDGVDEATEGDDGLVVISGVPDEQKRHTDGAETGDLAPLEGGVTQNSEPADLEGRG